MKNAALTLTLAGAVLLGGLAQAQTFTSGNPSDFAKVTLYDGDPADFGDVLATTMMGDSATASRLVGTGEDDASVEYVTIEIGGEVFTAETFPGGASKNSIYLDINNVDREDAMTLGELLNEIAEDPGTLAQLEQTSPSTSAQLVQSN